MRTCWLVTAVAAAAASYILVTMVLPNEREFADSPLLDAYDYVVVGGGSAGAVVAARLAETPGVSVLLLEAGRTDNVMSVRTPAMCAELQRSERDWGYKTVPQTHSQAAMIDRRSSWPRGKMLGGSSAINYMVYVRGAPGDFDDLWRVPGWSYSDVLPFFTKSENYSAVLDKATARGSPVYRDPDSFRGTDGPLAVSKPVLDSPLTAAFVASGAALGLPRNEDYNGGSGIFGTAHCDLTIGAGVRASSAAAFLRPALRASGSPSFGSLTVRTYAHVTRVLTEPHPDTGLPTAIGVQFVDTAHPDRPTLTVRATREVVLSAGAVGTPHILMLSGIGPKDHLESHGIPVVHHAPGVGANLRDHLMAPLRYTVSEKAKPHILSRARLNLGEIYNYLTEGSGVLATNGLSGTAFLNTGVDASDHLPDSVPDVQIHFIATGGSDVDAGNFGTDPKFINPDMAKDVSAWQQSGLNFLPILLHPRSTGSITLASADPFDHPLIQPNYLEDPRDVDALVAAIEATLAMASHPAFAPYINGSEPMRSHLYDGPPDDDLAYWRWHIRHFAATVYHPVGTARMGDPDTDPNAVVDPHLSVIGVANLRVADTSVMPKLISGNTNAPAIMVGERAAAFIHAAAQEQSAS